MSTQQEVINLLNEGTTYGGGEVRLDEAGSHSLPFREKNTSKCKASSKAFIIHWNDPS